ncbi:MULTISPECIES: DUF5908 family protein [Corallincola]|uniref:DUF5908 family protein n=1 Tax=Corallincola TaxID=1775176 RepID=UPI001313E252|nr:MULTISPECIES: DUF5908 family protein [Corallincola]
MPIVIDELIVTAEVTSPSGAETTTEQALSDLDREQLIRECVDEVLAVLERQSER